MGKPVNVLFNFYKRCSMERNQTVCVIGLGYIGLPTAALLANRGYQVHGVDINEEVVNRINQSQIHIVEPELDAFVRAAVQSGNLKASIQPEQADIFIIAVPTPFREQDYAPDLSYIESATQALTPYLKQHDLVILESTAPVGSTEQVQIVIDEQLGPQHGVDVAYCPERVLPGKVMRELVENDRIVGGVNQRATDKAVAFYETFVEGTVLQSDSRTAEMAKLTENSFRDTNIAFANELSMLCDQFDINVWQLIDLANQHPRVNILKPGPGVGGHCIAVDPWFIIHKGGETAKMMRTARDINTYKTQWVIEKIKNAALSFEKDQGRQAQVACMGLAFKPNIDDLRGSPALFITQQLVEADFNIVAVEPHVDHSDNIELVDLSDALQQADILVFLVGHHEFVGLNTQQKFQQQALDFCGVLET